VRGYGPPNHGPGDDWWATKFLREDFRKNLNEPEIEIVGRPKKKTGVYYGPGESLNDLKL
jgi:hypothetical protein